MTHNNPARPGTLVGSLLSSPNVRQVSQPQKAKIEPISPMTKALIVSPVNGSNHWMSKLRCRFDLAGPRDGDDRERRKDGHLEPDQHILHLLAGGDAATGDEGGDGE